jgi:hypothetical protein
MTEKQVAAKLLLAAALALSGSAAIAGPTVHKAALGSWCSVGPSDKGAFLYLEKIRDCDKPTDNLHVYPDHYEGWEYACRFTGVKTWFDPKIIANTKEWGVKVSRVEASCAGIDCTWKERLTVYVSKGAFVLKDVYQSREVCWKDSS